MITMCDVIDAMIAPTASSVFRSMDCEGIYFILPRSFEVLGIRQISSVCAISKFLLYRPISPLCSESIGSSSVESTGRFCQWMELFVL